jgi:hypothetical protein
MAENANAVSTRPSVQPRAGASIRPQTSAVSATNDSANPQPAAGHGPQRDPDAGEPSPDADRLAALVCRERRGQDRQRRRHDERAADPHHGTHRDQQFRRGGQRRSERAEPEDDQAERQRALATEPVAERAGGQQHSGEQQHVDVDDPLQLRGRRVEIALKRGESDVEDRVVEPDHEQ